LRQTISLYRKAVKVKISLSSSKQEAAEEEEEEA
jgi:hypothetical protein